MFTTIALFFSCHAFNKTNDSIMGSVEPAKLGNNTLKIASRADVRTHFNFNISDFDYKFVYYSVQSARLFEIYQADINCTLLKSPFIRSTECLELVSSLKSHYDPLILNEFKEWKKYLNECQKNKFIDQCKPLNNYFLTTKLVIIQKYMITIGYVCRCENSNTENFCKEAVNLNELAEKEFLEIISILHSKKLSHDQHISGTFRFEMNVMNNLPNLTFYGCSRYNDNMSNKNILNREIGVNATLLLDRN